MSFYIPEKLDLKKLVQENPPTGIRDFSINNIEFILSKINELSYKSKLEKYDGYTPLSSVELQKKMRNYRQYLDYLIRLNIIETDGTYIVGEKCLGFRYSQPFRNQKLRTVEDSSNSSRKNKKRLRDQKSVKNHGYLTKWWNDKLTIDSVGAFEYIESQQGKGTYTVNKYNSDLISITRMKERDYFYSIDGNVNRFHSNLTNLRKDLRNYVHYGGETLVSLDIKNSQPFFSLMLLEDSFYSTSKRGITFNNLNLTFDENFKKMMLDQRSELRTLINNIHSTEDFYNYQKLVLDGNLYEFLADQLTNELGLEYKYWILDKKTKKQKKCIPIKTNGRRLAKITIFMVLFSDNRFIGQDQEWSDARPKNVFKKTFPNVYKLFSHFKKYNKEDLARLLQGIESHMILNTICKKITRQKPGTPIYTIHDSVVTTNKNWVGVNDIMMEEIEKHIKYKPQIHYEPWKP